MRAERLVGPDRESAKALILAGHYSHSVPSGKSHYYKVGEAIIVYSIPANKNLGRFVLGRPGNVWELARLWAPDGHDPNLLSIALSRSAAALRDDEPGVEALVSFADPNVGHSGGVYRAASWVYTGQSEEGRYYRDQGGQVVSRRKFHSGRASLTKAEIIGLGYTELRLPGKHRFVRGLTRKSRRDIFNRWEQ